MLFCGLSVLEVTQLEAILHEPAPKDVIPQDVMP